ncbi:MAG: outer membrane lipoprotein-sorting protein [Sphaerochaetaceae bacterium]
MNDTKKAPFGTLIAIILWLAMMPAVYAQTDLPSPTGSMIMEQVTEGQKASSSAMDIQMTLIDTKGTQHSRRLQILSRTESQETRTITVFLSPASVKNTRFLSVERPDGGDDQWIFLPALGKVKRIAASERSGSFMGSDFTYADMASFSYGGDEAQHTLLRQENLGNHTCHVVESIPKTVSDYGKTITWVDTTTFVAIQVEFYDNNGSNPVKTLTSENIQQVDGKWVARMMTMTTLATGHKTRIEMSQVTYNVTLDPAYFTVAFLETGRI